METEISSAIMPSATEFDAALIRLRREVEDLSDPTLAHVSYDTLFNDKVLQALNTKGLKNAVEEYAQRYNELMSASLYFRKGTFDYYNAGQIATSLSNNGFFKANHTLRLHAEIGDQDIKSKNELVALIEQEKREILADETLRKRFDDVAKQLTRNVQLRAFCDYVRDDEAVLALLNNPEELRQEVLKSYLKANEDAYDDWMNKYDAARERRKSLEEDASRQRTQWENVIEIFNERFFVPFKLEAKNKTEVMLGQTSIIKLGFTYIDGDDRAEIGRPELLQSLSTGERKALYVLNVIFEMETRKHANQETLVVVDDLADSFDYRNKYAIIQYLRDISKDGLFKLLVMTHNFDFFRTIESRFVGYRNCLMASKGESGVVIAQAAGIQNIFARDWKKNFFKDQKKKIASIPFLRNLVEMTTGTGDSGYEQLTSILHWRARSGGITVGDLDRIYGNICGGTGESVNPIKLVIDLVMEEAESCLAAGAGMNLENKIVLAIAVRLGAERYMIDRIDDCEFLKRLKSNQAGRLIERFKEMFPEEREVIATLDRVALMTPENIHVNSFMYEPIIDMADDHLRKLFTDVQGLE